MDADSSVETRKAAGLTLLTVLLMIVSLQILDLILAIISDFVSPRTMATTHFMVMFVGHMTTMAFTLLALFCAALVLPLIALTPILILVLVLLHLSPL